MAIYKDVASLEVVGYTPPEDGTFADGVQFILEKLDAIPEADVESVHHGYWTERTDQSTYINGEKQIVKYCSVCGEAAPYNAVGKQFYPARCYCGAKMDRKESEN